MGSVLHPVYTRVCGDHGRVWVAAQPCWGLRSQGSSQPTSQVVREHGEFGMWATLQPQQREGSWGGQQASRQPSVTPGVHQGLLSMSGLAKVGWACLQTGDNPPVPAFPKENPSPRASLRPRLPNTPCDAHFLAILHHVLSFSSCWKGELSCGAPGGPEAVAAPLDCPVSCPCFTAPSAQVCKLPEQ